LQILFQPCEVPIEIIPSPRLFYCMHENAREPLNWRLSWNFISGRCTEIYWGIPIFVWNRVKMTKTYTYFEHNKLRKYLSQRIVFVEQNDKLIFFSICFYSYVFRSSRGLKDNCSPLRTSNKRTNSVAWVRERTIPTERPPLVCEVSANFFW
jgi:hypothetical protein